MNFFKELFSGFASLDWRMVVMWLIGGVLIFLAIKKKMEPALLLPMGLGAILVNLPLATTVAEGGAINTL
ncbi:MAG: sodium ion-translocating decarboxylase subunit beta, partial [Elusimicrobiaceae bacterium]|nr:sodium ion-translocating decarboxylase subunit beta [Elusimicrobiaceae bacterium]